MKIRNQSKKHCEENVICWKVEWNHKRGILTIELKPFPNIFYGINTIVQIQRNNYSWLYFVKSY